MDLSVKNYACKIFPFGSPLPFGIVSVNIHAVNIISVKYCKSDEMYPERVWVNGSEVFAASYCSPGLGSFVNSRR